MKDDSVFCKAGENKEETSQHPDVNCFHVGNLWGEWISPYIPYNKNETPAGWGFEQRWTWKWKWGELSHREPAGQESEARQLKKVPKNLDIHVGNTWSLGTKKEMKATTMRMTEGRKVWLMWKVSFLWGVVNRLNWEKKNLPRKNPLKCHTKTSYNWSSPAITDPRQL